MLYNGPSAATGIGAAGTAGAFGFSGVSPFFIALAVFTLIGAGAAFLRVLPRFQKH